MSNMKKNNKYTYHRGTMTTDHGSRHYEIQGARLPSVTTILAKTKDDTYLKRWYAKTGYDEAERIKNHSTLRGRAMHKFIEKHILGHGHEDLTPIGQEAKPMAKKIIEEGLLPVETYFGSEVTLYYPGLYAGATDLICEHHGMESIVDFKKDYVNMKDDGYYFLSQFEEGGESSFIPLVDLEIDVICPCNGKTLKVNVNEEVTEWKGNGTLDAFFNIV